MENGEIADGDTNTILGIDIVVHDPPTDVGEFDKGFWNLSKVGFFNEKDMEVVYLNSNQVDSVEGIQLIVGRNPAEEVKDSGKEKWKQKSIEELLCMPKSKKEGRQEEAKVCCSDQQLLQLRYHVKASTDQQQKHDLCK